VDRCPEPGDLVGNHDRTALLAFTFVYLFSNCGCAGNSQEGGGHLSIFRPAGTSPQRTGLSKSRPCRRGPSGHSPRRAVTDGFWRPHARTPSTGLGPLEPVKPHGGKSWKRGFVVAYYSAGKGPPDGRGAAHEHLLKRPWVSGCGV